jgi:hypothetical protein
VCWDVTDRIPDFRAPSFSVPGSRGNSKCTPFLHKSRPLKEAEERWNVPVQSSDSFFARIERVIYEWDRSLGGVTKGLAAILFSLRYVGWGSKCKRNRPSLCFRQGSPVVFKYTLTKINKKSQSIHKSCLECDFVFFIYRLSIVSYWRNVWVFCLYLGAFANLWKATSSFVMSVCPYETTWHPLDGFS